MELRERKKFRKEEYVYDDDENDDYSDSDSTATTPDELECVIDNSEINETAVRYLF